ncbi:MAG: hypothetical protein JXR46_01930 [Calditrichaceae bacterium]|nr:hypothetical protein [Calditrichaceae bacterium]MBN2707779.1 hypothetical protein [Calditrichaceae bacterium]RQV96413.1 MAG: hypothetical protein EH224_04790 [Calditrichota bacterium]
MWDAVHRNLLDLEDHVDGKVFRRSFAARPVFHGKINGNELTINFSTDKIDKQRYTYIDISLSGASKFNCTLTSHSWLKKQNAGEINDYISVRNTENVEYLLRPASDPGVKKLSKKTALVQLLDDFQGLAYLFIGKTGILCELETTAVVKATEVETLKKRLLLLDQLAGATG